MIIFIITGFLILLYLAYPLWLMTFSGKNEDEKVTGKAANGVSLVLLTYNGKTYLAEKIGFLLKELSFTENYELIIVDDGSRDGTKDLLEQYRSNTRIQLILKDQNRGIPHSMNLAVRNCIYDQIIFCDQRQGLSTGIVGEISKALNNPNTGAVSACISDHGRQHRCSRLRRHENFLKSRESLSGNLIGVYGPLYGIRKECYSEIPDHIILDDLYLSLKILKSKQIRLLENCLVADDDMSHLYNYKRTKRYLRGFLQLAEEKSLISQLRSRQIVMLLWHKYLRLLIPLFLVISYITLGIMGIRDDRFLIPFVTLTILAILSLLPVRSKTWQGIHNLIRIIVFYVLALADILISRPIIRPEQNEAMA